MEKQPRNSYKGSQLQSQPQTQERIPRRGLLRRRWPILLRILILILSISTIYYLKSFKEEQGLHEQIQGFVQNKVQDEQNDYVVDQRSEESIVKKFEQMKADHQKALQLAEENPNDPKILYKLISLTYQLNEFEEAFELGQKLTRLIPEDEEFKNILQTIKRQDLKNKEAAHNMEVSIFGSANHHLKIKEDSVQKFWTNIYDLSEELFQYRSQILRKVADDLGVLKKHPNFRQSMLMLKRKMGIDYGHIEGVYDLSINSMHQLIVNGISADILLNDEVDSVLKKLPLKMKHMRADSIAKIINDNIEVIDMLESFAKENGKLKKELIKKLHLLFTRNARYIDHNPTSLDLIRRGKWKLFTNYVTSPDLTNLYQNKVQIKFFAPPSKVDESLSKMIEIYDELKQKNVLPQVLAAWIHATFINIHPFDDGNGRVARALTSLVLLQNNLLPFNIDEVTKPSYIKSLQMSSEGNISTLIQLIENQQLKGFEAFKELVVNKKDS